MTLQILPKELQITIYGELNINELKILYNTSNSVQLLLNSKEMLNYLYYKYDIKSTSFDNFIQLYKQKIFMLLNRLGKIYHAAWGFDWDNESYGNYQYAVEALKNGETVFLEGELGFENPYDEDRVVTFVDELDELDLDSTYGSYPNEYPEQLESLATMIMPYKIIIIVQNKVSRYLNPHEWYLKDTPSYIDIVTPFKKIILNADIKGKDLTIKDVLFASRAMALDKYNTVVENTYTILEDNDILKIKID